MSPQEQAYDLETLVKQLYELAGEEEAEVAIRRKSIIERIKEAIAKVEKALGDFEVSTVTLTISLYPSASVTFGRKPE